MGSKIKKNFPEPYPKICMFDNLGNIFLFNKKKLQSFHLSPFVVR